MSNAVNPKKVFELDEEFFKLRKRFLESNSLVFFKDYERLIRNHSKYNWDDITTAVWGSGTVRHVPQCDGSRNLFGVAETLRPDKLIVTDSRLNIQSRATGETNVEVHRVVKDTTFSGAFHSFRKDLNELCFTQHQIIVFFEKYRQRLNPDARNAFLSRVGDRFVIFNLFLSWDEEWKYHLLEFENYQKDQLFAVNDQFLIIPTYESKIK